MAQNISLLGADYPDVPAVVLPKTGGGSARFDDVSEDTVSSSRVLSGYVGHNANGRFEGNIQSLPAAVINVSSSVQTIQSGKYLAGAQTIRAVETSNVQAAKIKCGVRVRVGDVDNIGRIRDVTGTFTDSSTVSSGQTAAAAAQIWAGYSAWVDGAEVQGTFNLFALTVDQLMAQSPTGVYGMTVSELLAE